MSQFAQLVYWWWYGDGQNCKPHFLSPSAHPPYSVPNCLKVTSDYFRSSNLEMQINSEKVFLLLR